MRLLPYVLLCNLIFFSACVPVAEPEPVNDDNQAGNAALDVATVPATRPSATASETPTPIRPTPTLTIDPTVLTLTPWPPDPLPSPTPIAAFPGMYYRTQEGLWLVDNQWQPQFLKAGLDVSPGPGDYLLLTEADDIWLWHRFTGEQQNLTNTPEQVECCAELWESDSTKIHYLRNPGFGSGVPVLYDLVSGKETVLSQGPTDQTMSEMAGSPNGRYFAYSLNGTELWLYDDETQTATAVDFSAYPALDGYQIARLGSPSWSPSSTHIAVYMALQSEEEPWQIALIVFDVEGNMAWRYRPHNNIGRDGWFSAAQWNPDGSWIAFVTEDVDQTQAGVWLINTAFNVEKQIPGASNPIWSPDGQELIYQTDEGTFLTYGPDFTYKIQIILPEGGTVIDWVERP